MTSFLNVPVHVCPRQFTTAPDGAEIPAHLVALTAVPTHGRHVWSCSAGKLGKGEGSHIDKADNVLSDDSQQDGKGEGAAKPEEVHQQLCIVVDLSQHADTCMNQNTLTTVPEGSKLSELPQLIPQWSIASWRARPNS